MARETFPDHTPTSGKHRALHLGTDPGIPEWNSATLPGPNHGGNVWLSMKGGERMPFTLSLFHQVRRFNIARESLMAHRHPPYTEPGRLAVRETALCRADLTLESAGTEHGGCPCGSLLVVIGAWFDVKLKATRVPIFILDCYLVV